MVWRPLVVGEDGARSEAAIATIAAAIPRLAPSGASLAHGTAGAAVFYSYLARSGRGGAQRAEDYLERAMAAVGDEPMTPSLHEGFTGIGWAVQHLIEDVDDVISEIDSALLEVASRSPWTERYDLVSGLIGFGVYALERRPRGAADAILDKVVARLDELAVPVGAGRSLRTPAEAFPAELRGAGSGELYTTGAAHGVAAAIGLLGSVPGDRATGVRHALTTWLASVTDPRSDGSTYPPLVAGSGPGRPLGTRNAAWCSGDPGIAAALFRGGRAAGDRMLELRALIAAHAAAGRPAAHSGVGDPAICHGTAGLLHIFNRLYQATGQPVFRDAALRWLDATLAFHDEEARQFRLGPPGAGSPRQPGGACGLLTGLGGIGLALLAAVSDHEPRWDIVLLCDAGRA
jgi:lantibiotic modifying enzyme